MYYARSCTDYYLLVVIIKPRANRNTDIHVTNGTKMNDDIWASEVNVVKQYFHRCCLVSTKLFFTVSSFDAIYAFLYKWWTRAVYMINHQSLNDMFINQKLDEPVEPQGRLSSGCCLYKQSPFHYDMLKKHTLHKPIQHQAFVDMIS